MAKRYLTSALMPPVGACRFGCGSSCAAPVTVFWLFGVVSVIYGFLGGPTAEPGISWYTVGLGVVMWGVAALWAILSIQGSAADRCDSSWRGHDRDMAGRDAESDPFDEVKKAL
ncbi:MAG: hypothetical protein H6959_00435 [Chromatiaceae bacterium]|nr:hypothetical protein [Gammaproteobacteria bacterium]MCP5301169.1 hypothetical protein [Chromatiaceae bacterium]MCP5421359.1 hypothetical protein [Chromatiaceae bacterium]